MELAEFLGAVIVCTIQRVPRATVSWQKDGELWSVKVTSPVRLWKTFALYKRFSTLEINTVEEMAEQFAIEFETALKAEKDRG